MTETTDRDGDDLRRTVLGLLGGEVGTLRPSEVTVRTSQAEDGWVTEDLAFRIDGGDEISAWFLRPAKAPGPTPAVLYCHAHGGRYDIGRNEIFDGRAALQSPYAADLLGLGCAVLCLEMPTFGARAAPNESSLSKRMLWEGRTLFGRMLAEQTLGLDFLCNHEAVDPERIAAMGISMGGTLAWWLAALDERIHATIQMCTFADLACLVESGAHDGHGHYMTVPGLLNVTSTGTLAGLAAPRAQLVCVGLGDKFTPLACFSKARDELAAAYHRHGAGDRLLFNVSQDTGHVETAAMRADCLAFLRTHLVGN